MAANIFCQCLNADINTVMEGVKHHPSGIGVVECDGDTAFMRCRHDCWHILYFHCYRPRTLTPDQACVIPDQGRDVRANEWVIGLNLDSKIPQDAFGHFFVGSIGGKRYQRMTASTAIGHVNKGNCCLSAWHDEAVMRTLQMRDPCCKLK